MMTVSNTVEPGYNDIGLYDASLIESDFCGTNQFVTVNHNITHLGYNNTRL
jgi:hypothetical protein